MRVREAMIGTAVGAGGVAAASILSWALEPLTGTPSLAPIIASVAVLSVLFGTLSGVVATMLGAFLASWALFAPHFSFAIDGNEIARTGLVVALCLGLASLGGRWRASRRRLAREREDHRRTSDALQQALVPVVARRINGIRMAQVFLPHGAGESIGGDFLDAFALPDGDVVMVIGDVCGKGPRSGQLASVARGAIRLAAGTTHSPAQALKQANGEVLAFSGDGATFVAVTLVRLSPVARGIRAVVACSGQPRPYLVRPNGAVLPVGVPGMPLGIQPDPPITSVDCVLHPGDALVAFSDGVTDVRPGREHAMWGEGGLAAALTRVAGGDPADIARAIEDGVRRQSGEHPSDDIAALIAAPMPQPAHDGRASDWDLHGASAVTDGVTGAV